VAFAAALAVAVIASSRARADIVLGTAVNYGILVESGANSYQLNNSVVHGNVGIGSGLGAGQVQIASNGFIDELIPGQANTGQLLIADPTATVSNPGNVQGGVLLSQTQVNTALTTVNNLNSTLGAEAGTALTISGSGQVINATAGTLDGSGNFVFTVAANGFNNNATGITINGTASQFVVININNGTSNEAIGGPISLSGGITPDHVLFNYVGTGGILSSSTNKAVVNGIFLAPHMAINLDNININGRLFGGRAGTDFQTVSGFSLFVAIPEPSTVALGLVTVVIGLGYARYRGKRPAAA
jgi:hypothetical protein